MTRAATAWGIVACAIWCATVAFVRGLTQDVGTWRAGMLFLGLAGGLGLLRSALAGRWRADLKGVSWHYLVGCGSCFVAYQVLLLRAIGLAATGPAVVVVGLLNYLWPALTLLLSVPLLGCRARRWLAPGLLLTVAGEWLVVGGGQPLPALDRQAAAPYALAAVAAVCWALYSNLARRLAPDFQGNAVPLFLLATGVALAPCALSQHEPLHLTARTPWLLAYMVVCPGLLAYSWWDRGMRRGDAKLLTLCSYLIPLGSTAITSALLHLWPAWPVWLGAAAVIAGALLCHHGVTSQQGQEHFSQLEPPS